MYNVYLVCVILTLYDNHIIQYQYFIPRLLYPNTVLRLPRLNFPIFVLYICKCWEMLCTYNTYEMMSKNFYLIRDKMQFFSFTVYIINIGFNVVIWLSYIYYPLIFVSDLAILLLCTVGHHNMNIDILILVLNSRVSPYQYLRCSDSSFYI